MAHVAAVIAFLTSQADDDRVVVGDAVDVILSAHSLACLIHAAVEAGRQSRAFGIGLANRQVVGAESPRRRHAGKAGIAIVHHVVATCLATVGDFIDTAASRAFLAEEAIGDVEVIVHAIGRHLCTGGGAHGIVRRAGIDAIGEIDAIGVERTRLQLVSTNAVESAVLTRGAIHRGIASAGGGAITIEASDAGRTNRTAHAAIGFVVLQIDALRAALGQTDAARGAACAIGTNFTRRARFAAHAAIARIELRIDAGAVALGRTGSALRGALAIGANFVHGTNDAASAAVARIDLRVDAGVGAFRRSAGTIEVAFATRANFARTANRSARAAVQSIVFRIDAGRAAFRRSADAGQTARAIGTNLALSTHGSTHTAIGHVGFQIDAEIAAFRGLSDAIERAFAGRADFSNGTSGSASTAVRRVDLDIDAFIGALRRSTNTRKSAFTIGTNLAVHALGTARTAVVRIERRNGARAIAIGLSGRTCRGSATGAALSCVTTGAHSGAAPGTAHIAAGTGHSAGATAAAALTATSGARRIRVGVRAATDNCHGAKKHGQRSNPTCEANALFFLRIKIHSYLPPWLENQIVLNPIDSNASPRRIAIGNAQKGT